VKYLFLTMTKLIEYKTPLFAGNLYFFIPLVFWFLCIIVIWETRRTIVAFLGHLFCMWNICSEPWQNWLNTKLLYLLVIYIFFIPLVFWFLCIIVIWETRRTIVAFLGHFFCMWVTVVGLRYSTLFCEKIGIYAEKDFKDEWIKT
jgi:hypothetical protein